MRVGKLPCDPADNSLFQLVGLRTWECGSGGPVGIGEYPAHEAVPDGEPYAASRLPTAVLQPHPDYVVVVANPDRCHEVRGEPNEPGVGVVACGACFAPGLPAGVGASPVPSAPAPVPDLSTDWSMLFIRKAPVTLRTLLPGSGRSLLSRRFPMRSSTLRMAVVFMASRLWRMECMPLPSPGGWRSSCPGAGSSLWEALR